MKKFGMMIMTAALMLSSASAMAMRIDFNGGEYSLPECGGTIEAKGGYQSALTGGDPTQINVIVRGSRQCSNFIMENTGREYKLQDGSNGRGGSYTITSGSLHMGWNQVNLTVRSNSGSHSDDVSIWVKVEGSNNGGDDHACSDEAEAAARDKYFSQYSRKAKSADATFIRTSHSGNYVFDINVRGRSGDASYEAVMSRDCSLVEIKNN